ncbi:hypothetical protein PENTCL1PPCAC_26681 [Pristionchus entomophagus]|uniref:G protein-coupled receptor n=1 Tax=Pristionchus entomophagus TaxID=358040 RepID=A0AAV5UCE4_9BILA|nr:hypothetical protein PENTCL1PPCAC_26681 [Pristionchus entomophagus]
MPQSAFGNQPFFPVQQSPFHSTTRQPMQSNVSNQRQLPDYWTPFTCCGASNGTWALVIMLVILVDCSVLFIRSMQDVVNESGNVSVVNGITGGLALIHALTSLVALIQISEGKTTGLSTLLTLLFVDYFISGCVILMSIIASCIYGDALSSPSTSVSDKNGKENTIGLTQAIFIAIVYLILLPLIKFSRCSLTIARRCEWSTLITIRKYGILTLMSTSNHCIYVTHYTLFTLPDIVVYTYLSC